MWDAITSIIYTVHQYSDDDDDDDERIYFNVAQVLGLQGHVTVIVGSQCSETFISQSSCKTEQKVQSSVYRGKLAQYKPLASPQLT